MGRATRTRSGDIPLYSISTGPSGYLSHIVGAPLRRAWRQLRGGATVRRRAPLQLVHPGPKSTAPRALLAYLRAPFESGDSAFDAAFHTNWEHARIIADVLGELGYQVDVAGPLDDPDADADRYDLLVGELAAFVRSLRCVRHEGRKVYFATRAHPWAEYESVQRYLEQVRRQTGFRFRNPLHREWYAQAAQGLAHADAIVAIGNTFTARSFDREGIPVVPVANTALFRGRVPVDAKDYAQARRHFLWLGSGPLVNKGLAPVLSAFARNPHLHLWVCGPLASVKEAPTVWAFRRQLFESQNVHPVGWVDVRSELFTKLLHTCGWIVSASYSEGMSGGVVLGAANGLVPIVAPQVGLDCETYGILAESPGEDEMCEALRQAWTLSSDELRQRSGRALAAAAASATPSAFRRRFHSAMRRLIDDRSHRPSATAASSLRVRDGRP